MTTNLEHSDQRKNMVQESLSDIFKSLKLAPKTEEHKESPEIMKIWKYFGKITELSTILNSVKERNCNNQPTRKQLQEREEEKLNPFSLITEDGKIGSAVRTNFSLNFSNISGDLLGSKVLQFKIYNNEEIPVKFEKRM